MAKPLGGRGALAHRPVLLRETIELLAAERGGLFVDCTVGLGGHSEAILQASSDAQVLGIDRDEEALELARRRLALYGSRFRSVHADFRELTRVLATAKVRQVRGVLADLGVSSLQLDSPQRGFSFRHDAPLDMRMDMSRGETAGELLGRLSEVEIANLIFELGEEKGSRRIARAIVQRRERGEPVATTTDLANLVERAVGKGNKRRIHPATRTFQALRIAVNAELESLDRFLFDAVDYLEQAGRLAVISFHSLEDRIIKRTLLRLSGKCQCPPRLPKCICGATKQVEILTKRAIVPDEVEIEENPRSRSAKLRCAEKI
ncbi:MAG TPA: 16S rRNA (cytosine(1402)-N(4))-methyltransferase RsmH [Pyrinomonadaceae bacterium]|jgi:16S rRNA (cytosine1402-N4)-methyltransferase|nr:16S rRNA (cytosine(1402)-N(4))-methyltransferase RsmH [Pyrinomonadaceae bacterium]